MSLPSYAMNQTSFPHMYEQSLVGPLFRPWAEMTVETRIRSGQSVFKTTSLLMRQVPLWSNGVKHG